MMTFWLLLCGEINYHLSSINNYDASFNKFCSLRDELYISCLRQSFCNRILANSLQRKINLLRSQTDTLN